MSRPHRVGAHRSASTRSWPRWAILLGALAVAVVLTAAGLFALDRLRPQAPVPTETAPAVVTDPSQIDPALDASITVLDEDGDDHAFAAGVGQALADAGWPVVATGGSTGGDDRTVVWFDAPELEPVARGIAQQLGVGQALQSDGRVSGTPITVVLGTDAVGTAPSTEPDVDSEVSRAPEP